MNEDGVMGRGWKGGSWLLRGLLNGAAQDRRWAKAIEVAAAIYGGSRSSLMRLV
jgi:hypothetical protein